MKIHRLVLSTILLLLLLGNTTALAQVQFKAYTNSRTVKVGEVFTVTFTIINGKPSKFTPPSFEGFKQSGAMGTSSSFSNINGKMSQSISYNFNLYALAEGKFIIDPAQATFNNKTIKSNPLEISVTTSNSPIGTADDDVFVRAEINYTEAYAGQQLLLTYKLYRSIPVANYNILEMPDYKGFYKEDIRRFNGIEQIETINGEKFATKILKKIALFPQETGTLTISPMLLRLGIPKETDNNDPFGRFFQETVTLPVRTNEVKVEVLALENPPRNFCGGVGDFSGSFKIDRTKLTTDDAFTLEISLAGNADVKRVTAPDLMLSDSFEIYEPRILVEETGEENGEITFLKTFQYLILPQEPGNYQLRPTLTYFDPDEKKYIPLSSNETYTIQVAKGKGISTVPFEDVNKEPKKDLRPIKLELGKSRDDENFVGSPLFLVLLALPLLGVVVGYFHDYYKKNKKKPDLAALKIKQAQTKAKQHLAKAKKFQEQNEVLSAYDEISKAMLGYVQDKFGIPPSEISKATVAQHLATHQIPEPQINTFVSLLSSCEIAIFGRKTNSLDLKEAYNTAYNIITDIEKSTV